MVEGCLRSGFQGQLLMCSKWNDPLNKKQTVRLNCSRQPRTVAGALELKRENGMRLGIAMYALLKPSPFQMLVKGGAFVDWMKLAIAVYSLLKPSPSQVLLEGRPFTHRSWQASSIIDGKYLSREKETWEFYNKLQQENNAYVILSGISQGKSEMMKEMCRNVKNGILYFDYLDPPALLQDLYWELGCYGRSIVVLTLTLLSLLGIGIKSSYKEFVEHQCRFAFGPNGLLAAASEEYMRKTGKKVICIIDNVTDKSDGDWLKLDDLKANETSPFCLVFVSRYEWCGRDCIAYVPPSKEEIQDFLLQHYKVTPQVAEDIISFTKQDMYRVKLLAGAHPKGRYESLKDFMTGLDQPLPWYILSGSKPQEETH